MTISFQRHKCFSHNSNLDAMQEIKTDHALVTSSFQVFASVSKDPLNKRKKGCFKRCFRWRIDAQIDEVLPHIWDPHIQVDATSQWQTLRALSNAVSTRKMGLRYVDPPFVKDLCKQRREVTDSAQRAWIVRAIFACRTAAKREWWKQLENAAGNGDSEAICYLRRRQRKPASTTAFARDSGAAKLQTAFVLIPWRSSANLLLILAKMKLSACSYSFGTVRPISFGCPSGRMKSNSL